MHLLDYNRDAEPPDGCRAIETDVDFLRFALTSDRLLVRGKTLCNWAELVWRERDIAYSVCSSLSEELRSCCQGLTPENASMILEQHRAALRALPRPLSALSVLDALFPSDLWHHNPSPAHAAAWLLWLHGQKPAEYSAPLFQHRCNEWQHLADGQLKPLYQATTPAAAVTLLRHWLRISESFPIPLADEFPLDVPEDLMREAAEVWTIRIIDTKGGFLDDLLKESIPRSLRDLCANLCFDFYTHNPACLTEQRLKTLRLHLSSQKTELLRKALRPPAPAQFPQDTKEIFPWFLDQYLPYREWATLTGSLPDIQVTQAIGAAFGRHFLESYPRFVMSEESLISFQKASALRSTYTAEVILYVILDGLNVPDALLLQRNIIRQCTRLTILRQTLCFAPVPTITAICKQALKKGYTPRMAALDKAGDPPNIKTLPEKKDPDAFLKSAAPGDIFIWSLMDPDETYHSKGWDRLTLRKEVTSRLESIAERIAKAALSVPSDRRAKIIVTTDHGRLLNASARTWPIPIGMHAHQRAALGRAAQEFPSNGILFSDSQPIAVLHNGTFHIDQDAAVILSEDSFFMEDGKKGAELFPHGGVFPEEVIIPWIEIGRDTHPPKLACRVDGEAQEGTSGLLRITVKNPGSLDLRLLRLHIAFGSQHAVEIPLNETIGAWESKLIEKRIDRWPSEMDIEKATARLFTQKPAGDEFTVTPEVKLKSLGFQSRSDILDELA